MINSPISDSTLQSTQQKLTIKTLAVISRVLSCPLMGSKPA